MLVVNLNTDGALSLGFFDLPWEVAPSTGIDAIVMIDHVMVFSGVAVSVADALLMRFPAADAFLGTLRRGRLLSLTVRQGSVLFDLDGADDAVSFIDTCGPTI